MCFPWTAPLRSYLQWVFLGLVFQPAWLGAAGPNASKPNFVIVLADDLGYGDLGCYGSDVIPTPRIDQMAKEGVRYTDFSVASPFCSPSRAALLTGRLPARCGVPYVLFPTEHTGLPPSEVTIAELLGGGGYATGCIGKWHLGWREELRPQRQGFETFFGLLHTNDIELWSEGRPFHQLSTFEPLQLREGDRVVESPVDQSLLTQKYTERAMEFIRLHKDRPFFLYLAHTMPHIPQHVSPAFEGKSRDGLYGDCVAEIDWSMGCILDLLKELDLDEQTLVVITSDNGSGVRGGKAKPNEKFPGRSLSGSNGTLRGGKGTTFEGGIRVPCVAWWPGKMGAGRVDDMPWSALDFFPTFAHLANVPVPKDVTFDGRDVSDSFLSGNTLAVERSMYHYFGVQLQAVRKGGWKLYLPIAEPPERRVPSLWFEHQSGLFERQHRRWPAPTLYDLTEDISETRDLASDYPEVVKELLNSAQRFDNEFQKQIPDVLYLPGPKPPVPGQIRKPSDDSEAWLRLTR